MALGVGGGRVGEDAGGEPQERTGVHGAAGVLRGQPIADELASLHQMAASKPECGMKGDGQRDDLKGKIGGEVVATHVGELVGEDGVEFLGREGLDHPVRQDEELGAPSDGDGAGNSWDGDESGARLEAGFVGGPDGLELRR